MADEGQETLPFERGRPTSRAGAASASSRAEGDRARVLRFITGRGIRGATDDEAEIALELAHTTTSARRRGLYLVGSVVWCGETRKTRRGVRANVWIAKSVAIGGMIPEVALPSTVEEVRDDVLFRACQLVEVRANGDPCGAEFEDLELAVRKYLGRM